MILPADTWTTVAHSPAPGVWHWLSDYDAKTLKRDVERGDLVVMHKRVADAEFQLLARPACQAWRRIRRRLADNPLPARVVRR